MPAPSEVTLRVPLAAAVARYAPPLDLDADPVLRAEYERGQADAAAGREAQAPSHDGESGSQDFWRRHAAYWLGRGSEPVDPPAPLVIGLGLTFVERTAATWSADGLATLGRQPGAVLGRAALTVVAGALHAHARGAADRRLTLPPEQRPRLVGVFKALALSSLKLVVSGLRRWRGHPAPPLSPAEQVSDAVSAELVLQMSWRAALRSPARTPAR